MTFIIEIEATATQQIQLAILIDGEVVWPWSRDDGSSEFDPEDVLSYLADSWPSLLLRQSWPIPFDRDQEPRSLTGIERAAEERWDQLSERENRIIEKESEIIDAFLYNHDLSQMKFGSGIPSCYVLRQQNSVMIEVDGRRFKDVNAKDFFENLNRLAQTAVSLLDSRKHISSISRLISRWLATESNQDPMAIAAFITGEDPADIAVEEELRETFTRIFSGRKLSEIANDNANPFAAAARSSGPLGVGTLGEVMRCLRDIPPGNVKPLYQLSYEVRGHVRQIPSPREQGIRAAAFLREKFGLGTNDRVDLDEMSKRFSISVKYLDMTDRRLDGIASASKEHGPAILLNKNTQRRGTGSEDLERSLRFTLAHEIGHLLLDFQEWPALVDALKKNVPRALETRANAFATYLLLQPSVANKYWEDGARPLDWDRLEAVLNRLTKFFGIPRIVAARQLARSVSDNDRNALNTVLSHNVNNFLGSEQ